MKREKYTFADFQEENYYPSADPYFAYKDKLTIGQIGLGIEEITNEPPKRLSEEVVEHFEKFVKRENLDELI